MIRDILYALGATFRRTGEAFADPIRRLHIAVMVGRLTVDAAVVIAVLPTSVWLTAPAAVAVNYALYEYVLEPWSKARVRAGKASLVDAYWEGGPRSDEGERFTYE